MAKIYDIKIDYFESMFTAELEASEIKSPLFQQLMTSTGHLEETVQVEGYYSVSFKGRYLEPCLEVYGLIAKGPFGKEVPLNDTDVNISLLSVELFDILDVDKALAIKRYKLEARNEEFESD